MSLFRKFLDALSAFTGNRRGNVAMIFGLALLPLALASGAALDYARAVIVRTSLAEALDAAGLAVGGSPTMSQTDMQALAQSYFNANYKEDASYGTPTAVTVVQNGQDFALASSVSVPTILLRLAGLNEIPVSYSVTITRNSKNLEVALALDVTGSMAGTRIADLKTAADDLIDIVVQDTQSPTYSKVAIAPYTNAVNVGSYATQVRGPVVGTATITGATQTKPVVVTAANHGYANGEVIYIAGVSGMTQLNKNFYTVTNKTTNTFELYSTSGSRIDGTYYSKYTSGGSAYCIKYGCELYRFTAQGGNTQMFEASTCVTERATNAFTDAAPSTTYLGFDYSAQTPSVPSPYPSYQNPYSANPCPTPTIIPLSSDRTALKNVVDNLSAGGSTAGHIGVAWAWYMLSPNFGYLWPGGSAAAVYDAPNTMKFAVIMTDGAFNSPYCNGVISQDAASGSGDSRDHNSCSSPNGSSANQAAQLCSAMKAKGIIVYTVGFTISNDPAAVSLLTNCATDADHAYFPQSGSDLKNAFHDIAQQITNLRVKS